MFGQFHFSLTWSTICGIILHGPFQFVDLSESTHIEYAHITAKSVLPSREGNKKTSCDAMVIFGQIRATQRVRCVLFDLWIADFAAASV
jgi:hypothetical protein